MGWLRGRPCAEVIHAGLEAQLPGVEVHRRDLAVVRLGDVHIQRLALVDEGRAVGGQLQDHLLRDFPHRLVQRLDVVRNPIEILWRGERGGREGGFARFELFI